MIERGGNVDRVIAHTPEPWRIGRTGITGAVSIVAGDRPPTLVTEVIQSCTDQPAMENARRIVACVNACAGIPTEELEQGVVQALIEALERITDYQPALVGESQELHQEIDGCPECKRARERKWPPSGLCNHHAMFFLVEGRAARRNVYMREIARTALARVRGEE